MKKLWISIVIIIMIVCLVGCFGKSNKKENFTETSQSTEPSKKDEVGDISEQEPLSDREEIVSDNDKEEENTYGLDSWSDSVPSSSDGDDNKTDVSVTPSEKSDSEKNDSEKDDSEEDDNEVNQSDFEFVEPITNGGNFNGKR